MSEVEIVGPSYELIQEIDPVDLPEIIASQVTGLKELSGKVSEALGKAKRASSEVDNSTYSTTLLFFADSEKNFETLNRGQKDIAAATQAISEGLEIAYKNQEALADISKYLFALGCSSIAANRSVVRQLELELSGASSGELKALAKRELYGVIRQLKAQEDVLEKLDRLKENDKTLKEDLASTAYELEQLRLDHNRTTTRLSLLENSFSEDQRQQVKAHEVIAAKLQHLGENDDALREELVQKADALEQIRFQYDNVTNRLCLLEKNFSETEARISSIKSNIKFSYIVGGLGLALGIMSLLF